MNSGDQSPEGMYALQVPIFFDTSTEYNSQSQDTQETDIPLKTGDRNLADLSWPGKTLADLL